MIGIKDIIGVWPVVLTQDFGVPWVNDKSVLHNGVDLALPKFHTIHFPLDGIITRCSYHFSDPLHAFGNRVSQLVIINEKKLELYFCHLDGCNPVNLIPSKLDGERLADTYPRVKTADIAGWVGNTGSAKGIHLHFGVRDLLTGEWLNPHDYVQLDK